MTQHGLVSSPQPAVPPFRYEALPMRVPFGSGAIKSLPAKSADLGLQRVLVVCTPGQATWPTSRPARGPQCRIFDKASMHVPVEPPTRPATSPSAAGADGCVVVGGGSTIGLGKAIALEHGFPSSRSPPPTPAPR